MNEKYIFAVGTACIWSEGAGSHPALTDQPLLILIFFDNVVLKNIVAHNEVALYCCSLLHAVAAQRV
jgi:hypothetical protein